MPSNKYTLISIHTKILLLSLEFRITGNTLPKESPKSFPQVKTNRWENNNYFTNHPTISIYNQKNATIKNTFSKFLSSGFLWQSQKKHPTKKPLVKSPSFLKMSSVLYNLHSEVLYESFSTIKEPNVLSSANTSWSGTTTKKTILFFLWISKLC